MSGEVLRLKVRAGVEFTDGRPIGVVYLVDTTVPLVERIYALPVVEALPMATRIMAGFHSGLRTIRVHARDRDAVLIELEIPAASALNASCTIRRFAERARFNAEQCRLFGSVAA